MTKLRDGEHKWKCPDAPESVSPTASTEMTQANDYLEAFMSDKISEIVQTENLEKNLMSFME